MHRSTPRTQRIATLGAAATLALVAQSGCTATAPAQPTPTSSSTSTEGQQTVAYPEMRTAVEAADPRVPAQVEWLDRIQGVVTASLEEDKAEDILVLDLTGRAADVLPRMNEASYDIVLVDADEEGVIDYVEHGLRLVRAGGTVLIPRVLAGGAVADPVRRDAVTTAYRTLIQETQASPAVLGALSIAGEGLLQLTTVAAEQR